MSLDDERDFDDLIDALGFGGDDLEDEDDLDDDDLGDEDDLDDDDLGDEDDLETELPDATTVHCPYCGEPVEVLLDAAGGGTQEYVEDCAVCCQPWSVRVTLDPSGGAHVEVSALDD